MIVDELLMFVCSSWN